MAAVAAGSLARALVRPTPARERLRLAATLAVLGVWTLIVIAGKAGELRGLQREAELLQYAVPGLALLWILLSRPHSSATARLVAGWTIAVAAALVGLDEVGTKLQNAVIPVVVVAGAALARRWPIQTLLAAGLLASLYNVVDAFTFVPTGSVMDLFLAAAWLALVYSWLTDRRRLPAGVNAALLPLGIYIGVTLLAALAAEDLQVSLYSFRSSAWLMTVVFLIPLWASDEHRRRLVHRGALLVGLVASAYAMLRWAIGPAAKEAAGATTSKYAKNDLGELNLIGGLASPKQLSVWASAMFAFALGSALTPIGAGWRLVAAATAGMSGAALFGADVRFGMVAGAAAGVGVVALFAFGRAFAGRRALPLAIVVVIAAIGVGVFVTTKLSAEGSSATRFKNLVTDPIGDYSVQDRLVKWRSLLADVDTRPFGRGLGSSGAAEVKYARFTTDASFDPDSAYVKVAYDQGFLVLGLFVAALVVLLLTLALVAVDSLDPLAGGRALAACGALIAFAVTLGGGAYFEGVPAMWSWLLVAVGCMGFVRWRRSHQGVPSPYA